MTVTPPDDLDVDLPFERIVEILLAAFAFSVMMSFLIV
jgi:hypothetical protein